MKNLLVTGGAGYIGSHNVKFLLEKGFQVVVLDDLSGGFLDAVQNEAIFVEGNIGSVEILDALFEKYNFDAVLNFASFIEVGESVQNPSKYYLNNVANTLVLLDAMVRHKIKKFIFSSTAAIFGIPDHVPIDETQPKHPINAYGRSKLMIEQLLPDYSKAYGLQSVCLRYFNAAGADPKGHLGERHDPETHLIPLVLQVASDTRDSITIFGNDYDTPDGTCVRDYVHVQDLAQAHWLALNYLEKHKQSAEFNLGNGSGYSIHEVINSVREVTGHNIPVEIGARREGDPARLVADSRLAKEQLAWAPEFSGLNEIVRHAWNWEQQNKT